MSRCSPLLFVIASVMLVVTLPATTASACASCGSGGEDPLILYPNETVKSYLGLSHAHDFQSFGADGTPISGGPDSRQTLLTSFGAAVSRNLFFTASLPMIRNVKDDYHRQGTGDPSLTARYTVHMQSLAEPVWIPQVQILAGYKPALASSIHELDQIKDPLAIFGSGFNELKLGSDIWFGMSRFKAGLAYIWIYSFPRTFEDQVKQPLSKHKLISTLGYSWSETTKTVGGLISDFNSGIKVDRSLQDDSAAQSTHAFIASDWQINPQNNIRLSFARQSAIGSSINGVRYDSYTMAHTYSF